MKQFHPEFFVALTDVLGALSNIPEENLQKNVAVGTGLAERLSPALRELVRQCEAADLSMSAMSGHRLISLINTPGSTYRRVAAQVNDFTTRLTDEMGRAFYFTIEPNRQPFLADGVNLFGDQVALNFPSAAVDIQEASKCYGLGRPTASVMHLMRVLEVGLTVLANDLQVSSDRQQWQVVIDQAEKAIKQIGPSKGTDWKAWEQFYSQAALEFRFFKNAWRNHAMHFRQHYDDAAAHVIYDHVKAFMNHLSTKLRETP